MHLAIPDLNVTIYKQAVKAIDLTLQNGEFLSGV